MKRERIYLLACALWAWLLCFFLLTHGETWAPFTAAGLVLVGVGFLRGIVPVKALRFSFEKVSLGIALGVGMVLITHALYELFAVLVPSLRPETKTLLTLLDVTGSTFPIRAALISIIASCEEILFRGPLGSEAPPKDASGRAAFAHSQVSLTLGLAGAYALTTAPLGSPLLLLVAFVCGSVWGFMRLATNSLAVPIVTHVIWDLGVLLVWPLSA